MKKGPIYSLIVGIVRFFMFFWHPCFKVVGRENVVKEGRLMICANHSGMADAIWVVFALKLGHIPRIMAKRQVLQIPVVGWILGKLGVFGVDRDGADIQAVKMGLRCLNDEQQLLIFPEGTRVKPGETVEPKRGAVTMAARTNTPILPVYLSTNKHFLSPVTCVIGKPYMLEYEGRKATDEELNRFSKELMEKIYGLGEGI